eukprot:g46972.t1
MSSEWLCRYLISIRSTLPRLQRRTRILDWNERKLKCATNYGPEGLLRVTVDFLKVELLFSHIVASRIYRCLAFRLCDVPLWRLYVIAFIIVVATVARLVLSLCYSAGMSEKKFEAIPGYKTTKRTLKEGAAGAPVVKAGDQVTVHALGVVSQTNKKFWSTKDPGQKPFSYQAGRGKVITGWDQGCLGMRLGESRELLIPAEEGYGVDGFPAWGIPPGGTLNFTIDVLKIN